MDFTGKLYELPKKPGKGSGRGAGPQAPHAAATLIYVEARGKGEARGLRDCIGDCAAAVVACPRRCRPDSPNTNTNTNTNSLPQS